MLFPRKKSLVLSILSTFTDAANGEESLCGTCLYVRFTGDCKYFWEGKACDVINPDTCVDDYCEGKTMESEKLQLVRSKKRDGIRTTTTTLKNINLRVAPANYKRENSQYKYRVTVITKEEVKAKEEFDYTGKFTWTWTDNWLNTKIVDLKKSDGTGKLIPDDISIPKPGEPVVGLLISDPCFRSASATSFFACEFSATFHTYERTPALINAFIDDTAFTNGNGIINRHAISYWGILGDNFYDRSGVGTDEFFGLVSMNVKKKPFITVHGNHDFWVLGEPETSTVMDQCGNGFTQYYGQDTESALINEKMNNSIHVNPYNMSIDPWAGHWVYGCNLPAKQNTFWASQIGNLFYIGYSATHSWRSYKEDFIGACEWATRNRDTIASIILVGHWNWCSRGCNAENGEKMDVPSVLARMRKLESCMAFSMPSAGPKSIAEGDNQQSNHLVSFDSSPKRFEKKSLQEKTQLYARKIRYIMGHTHCNNVQHLEEVGPGYMIGGFGMEGCGDYGIPIFDTTENRFRAYYFYIGGARNRDKFENVYDAFNITTQSSNRRSSETAALQSSHHQAETTGKPNSTTRQLDEPSFRTASPDMNYAAIIECVTKKGWRNCLHLAETWTDEPLMDPVAETWTTEPPVDEPLIDTLGKKQISSKSETQQKQIETRLDDAGETTLYA